MLRLSLISLVYNRSSWVIILLMDIHCSLRKFYLTLMIMMILKICSILVRIKSRNHFGGMKNNLMNRIRLWTWKISKSRKKYRRERLKRIASTLRNKRTTKNIVNNESNLSPPTTQVSSNGKTRWPNWKTVFSTGKTTKNTNR